VGNDTLVRSLERAPVEADIPGRKVGRGHREVVLVGRVDMAGKVGKAGRVDKIGVAVVGIVVL
jgi:hypothetical protein